MLLQESPPQCLTNDLGTSGLSFCRNLRCSDLRKSLFFLVCVTSPGQEANGLLGISIYLLVVAACTKVLQIDGVHTTPDIEFHAYVFAAI